MEPDDAQGVAHEKLAQLEEICAKRGRVLILMQDHPDPDALASALALRTVVNEVSGKHAVIGFGGRCGRAENRAMMRELKIDAERMTPAQLERFAIWCLVDAQPHTGNNLCRGPRNPDVVIDHHNLPKRRKWRSTLFDVRPEYGACSTILYQYLMAADVRMDNNLATALFYGIQSDTQDLGREASPAGALAYQQLFMQADKKKLSRIRRAPVPEAYFKMLIDGLVGCVVGENTVISCIPYCEDPDMIAEVADLLLRLEDKRSAVCYGLHKNTIHLSARAIDGRTNMSNRMKRVVSRIGTGGGHAVMAGGQVPVEKADPAKKLAQVHERILKVFAANEKTWPLVSGSHGSFTPLPFVQVSDLGDAKKPESNEADSG